MAHTSYVDALLAIATLVSLAQHKALKLAKVKAESFPRAKAISYRYKGKNEKFDDYLNSCRLEHKSHQ